MVEWLAKIAEILKLPFKYVWVLFLASGILLFSPKDWLKRINVEGFKEDNDKLIGFIFLLSMCMVVVNLCIWVGNGIRSAVGRRKIKKAAIEELERLDSSEKAVLREFFLQGQSTLKLPVDHPVIAGLLSKGILKRVGTLGEGSLAGILFPVIISPILRGEVTSDMVGLPIHRPSDEEVKKIMDSRPDFLFEILEHDRIFHTSWKRRLY